MIRRKLAHALRHALARFPAVALLGPRQAGKTTLARQLAAEDPAHYLMLDLERPSDLAKLAEPELYLSAARERCVVMDEIQHRPDLFPVLRALIDDDRRPGRFLVLGSASPDLLRQSSESLAGRIAFVELAPLSLDEVGADGLRRLWLRGGFPLSYLAADDADSADWREAFIRSHLERDIPQLGIRIPASRLYRFWQMVAHSHGQLWNASKIAGALGVSAPAVADYLDVLSDTFMLRRLPPYAANLKKRLVKAPRIYLRDSGLLHALLGISTADALAGHPVQGASWEGWAIEQILGCVPPDWRASFYRTAAGAEIDLILEDRGGAPRLAFDIKYSAAPAPTKGFWNGLRDLGIETAYVVAPVANGYPMGEGVRVLPPHALPAVFGVESTP